MSHLTFVGPERGATDEAGEISEKLNMWRKKHSFGKFFFTPSKLSAPHPSWAARQQSAAHVVQLKTSFLDNGTVNKNVVVVLDCAEVKKKCTKEVYDQACALHRARASTAKGDIIDNSGFTQASIVSFFELCPLMTVIGDHTRTAIYEISQSKPHLTLFQRTRAKLLMVDSDKHPDDLEFLISLGNRDNVTANLQREMKFADFVLQLRRQLECRNQLGEKADFKVISEIKKNRAFAWGLPLASVGQIYQIAKVSNRTEWELHYRLLTGAVEPMKGSKGLRKKDGEMIGANVATSAQYSTSLGNLSDAERIAVLTAVVEGNLDCGGCKVECDRLKAKNYVREEILKMANFVKKTKKGGKNFLAPMYPNWRELERQVPLCTEPTFVDGWVNWVVQNKKKAKDASKGEKKKELGTQEEFKRRVSELVTDSLATQVSELSLIHTPQLRMSKLNLIRTLSLACQSFA